MRTTSAKQISRLQSNPASIRNICILAHVDHGKTTLADTLVASNGIISSRMAGKLRYMDSREDEQIRGITMKSSAISLSHTKDGHEYLVNLMDSPGHIDFSSEVSTAVRLCDGCVVMVDVVEGVCPQTHAVLRQAWQENIKPVLVLNKIDRLILEWKMTPLEAHVHLMQTLEQVNAITGQLFSTEVYERDTLQQDKMKSNDNRNIDKDGNKPNADYSDYSVGLEDTDDSNLYFSPDQENVVFASAIDGWGFSVSHFADLYSKKLGLSARVLRKTLWGDFYLESKTKRIKKGAQFKGKKPLFVQFVLDNLWGVYEAVVDRRDKERTEKIIQSLNLKIPPRDLKHADSKVQLHAICGLWLPLSQAVLDMVISKLPSPLELQTERIERLLCPRDRDFASLPAEIKALKEEFLKCNSTDEAPVVVFVSKMFSADKKSLPQNKQRPLTQEEIAERRERVRQKHAERMAARELTKAEASSEQQTSDAGGTSASSSMATQATVLQPTATDSSDTTGDTEADHVFLAVARVFTGRIKRGAKLYVLAPKHNAEQALYENTDVSELKHVTEVTIDQLYLLMGRELDYLDEVPAGNILGIGGLQDVVLKSATVASTVYCPPFCEMNFEAQPIIRVAIEPKNAANMNKLVQGMKLLNQSDANIQVLVQESGEHVLVAAGEIHLKKCIDDLSQRFAQVDVTVSDPIVPFRETIVVPPKVDMVNEAIDSASNTVTNTDSAKPSEDQPKEVSITTTNGLSSIKIVAKPLPEDVSLLLEKNASLLRTLDTYNKAWLEGRTHILRDDTIRELLDFKSKLDSAFSSASDKWVNAVDKIWCFGPRKRGPNILLNDVPQYNSRGSVWSCLVQQDLDLWPADDSLVSGFQLSTSAGPLCREPMRGVCFVVQDWTIDAKARVRMDSECSTGEDGTSVEDATACEDSKPTTTTANTGTATSMTGATSGQLMSSMKSACHQAFQLCPQRVMVAMYSCEIQAPTDVLGRLHAVLSRCNGRVLSEDMKEGSSVFIIKAMLPVIDSFGFADEMRKRTSGLASPQLCFSHWEVIDVDPFWVPTTEEEYMHFGQKADSENIARRYVNMVRKRKGLHVDEQIVQHAEKQRTLSKKV